MCRREPLSRTPAGRSDGNTAPASGLFLEKPNRTGLVIITQPQIFTPWPRSASLTRTSLSMIRKPSRGTKRTRSGTEPKKLVLCSRGNNNGRPLLGGPVEAPWPREPAVAPWPRVAAAAPWPGALVAAPWSGNGVPSDTEARHVVRRPRGRNKLLRQK